VKGASSPDPRAVRAADNNARWCSSVCRVHGIPTSVAEGVWLAASQPPPFYPHAVTLRPGLSTETLAALLPRRGALAVKDSFADVDLAPMGFEVLFEADWIWRSGLVAGERPLLWQVVRGEDELSTWARAVDQPETFIPGLLDDPEVSFLLAREGHRVVGGAALSESVDVVGLSNVFALDGLGELWAGLADAVGSSRPGLPLCGYESGTDLTAAKAAGFETVGALRVWVRSG
jgi:hypothetical protein